MKRLILLVFLSLITLPVLAQHYDYREASNTIIGIFGGGGLATNHNYDVALSGGLDFNKGIGNRTGLGLALFYQQISVYYHNENHYGSEYHDLAGATVLHQSGYFFITPKFIHSLGRERLCKFYLDAGVGMKMSGTETLHKWDNTNGNAPGNYDSTLNTTPNITSMVVRIGFGFTEYIHMGRKWWFTVTEDFGFLANNVSSTADFTFPSKTPYTPNSLKPAYISLQLGISHTKY